MAKSSQVLLGFVDEPITENSSDDTYMINKIGGLPNTQNQSLLPKCSLCSRRTPLLIQIYAPVTHSIYHRTLYIHACVNPVCWNTSRSWICLRRQWVDTNHNDDKQQSATFIEWCDDADDWGQEPINEEVNGDVMTENQEIEICASASAELEISNAYAYDIVVAETIDFPKTDVLQLLDSRKKIPSVQENISIHFEPYYISVAYEESTETAKELVDLRNKYKKNQYIIENKSESYEKCLPAHGDKYFETFASIIRKNPGQILRYCRNKGKPLFLYEENVPNKCNYCQSKLLFELQILPSLIPYLKLNLGKDLHSTAHLEFGTALIYTCENSCWIEGDTYKYESVIVQEEKIF